MHGKIYLEKCKEVGMKPVAAAGVEMHRWGVETCGWEPKHVVEGRRVHYIEKTQKIKEKTRKIK
jgi:hypothetical protein